MMRLHRRGAGAVIAAGGLVGMSESVAKAAAKRILAGHWGILVMWTSSAPKSSLQCPLILQIALQCVYEEERLWPNLFEKDVWGA